MRRFRIGAVSLIASALVLLIQLVVALRWPDGYSITDNAISDLGVTACGAFSEHGRLVRDVCSPWHRAFNIGMIFSGLAILIGALLSRGFWDRKSGRVGAVFLAVSGVFVSAVGFTPWNVYPDVHDSVATGQAIAQWIAMALIAIALGRGVWRRITIVALAMSLLGFILFVLVLDGVTLPLLGFGGAERLSFDVLSIWVVLPGLAILQVNGDESVDGEDG